MQIPMNKRPLILFWLVCFAEAKGLVRGLVQPEPTERLTAAQTLLHPWVKAKASLCRQRALSDKSQGNAGCREAEAERVQRPTQSDASERRRRSGTTDSELSAPAGLQEPGSGSTDVDGQDAPQPGPESSDRHPVPGSPTTGLHAEYEQQLGDPPSTTESQSKQSPPCSPPPTAEQQQINCHSSSSKPAT